MPQPSDAKKAAWRNLLISPPILVVGSLFLVIVAPAIANATRRLFDSPRASSPGFTLSDGSYLVCSGHAIAMGYPFVWCVDRAVVWTIVPSLSTPARPLTEAEQKAEYVALRTASLDPANDADEIRFLAHPVDGPEIFWGRAALNLLCFLALLYAVDRVYRRVRAFVESKQARSSACVGCGYDLRGSLAEGRCPECGRKIDYTRFEPPAAG